MKKPRKPKIYWKIRAMQAGELVQEVFSWSNGSLPQTISPKATTVFGIVAAILSLRKKTLGVNHPSKILRGWTVVLGDFFDPTAVKNIISTATGTHARGSGFSDQSWRENESTFQLRYVLFKGHQFNILEISTPGGGKPRIYTDNETLFGEWFVTRFWEQFTPANFRYLDRGPESKVTVSTDVKISESFPVAQILRPVIEDIKTAWARGQTRNLLLSGEPGIGKSVMVRQIAEAVGTNKILRITGKGWNMLSEIMDMAEKVQPEILILDDLDSMGVFSAGSLGFFESKKFPLILATINDPKKFGDAMQISAFLRCGRFDHLMRVEQHHVDDVKRHLKSRIPFGEEVRVPDLPPAYLQEIVQQTVGTSIEETRAVVTRVTEHYEFLKNLTTEKSNKESPEVAVNLPGKPAKIERVRLKAEDLDLD